MALLIFSPLVTVIFSLSGESSLLSFNKERMQLWPVLEIFPSLWRENSSRDMKTELCTRVLELCSRSESDQVCGLSVDHRIFTRIDVDESFKCRTEYRILKYEHVKKYTEELKLQRTDCIYNIWLQPGNEPFLTGRPHSLIWCLLLGPSRQ